MKNKEFISVNQELKEAQKVSWSDVVSGDILVKGFLLRNWKFIFFLVVLMIGYIAHQHTCEGVEKQVKVLKKEVEVLRFKSMELRANLMQYSRQSQVMQRIEDRKLGLELSEEPLVILEE